MPVYPGAHNVPLFLRQTGYPEEFIMPYRTGQKALTPSGGMD